MPYERQIARAYGRGCGLALAAMLVGGVLGVALVATTLLVLGPDPRPGTLRVHLALLVAPVFVALVLLGTWLLIRGRNRPLDEVFAGLGLAGRQVAGVLRHWHGTFGGSGLDVWLRRGPTLELYLDCRTGTRGGITRAGPLLRRFGRLFSSLDPLDPAPPGFEGCTVYAGNEPWMRRWLARPEVRAGLGRLLAESERTAPLLHLRPDALHYVRAFLPLAEVTAKNVRAWIHDLEALARAVDDVGVAVPPLEPSKLERWTKQDRGRRFFPVFFGCLGLVLVAAFAGIYLLMILEHG